jgi:integrase
MGRRPTGTVEPLQGTIRLKFTWQGTRCVETLDLAPTPANMKAAHRRLAEILSAIQAGVYRPDRPGKTTQETFAEVADRWFKSKNGAKSTLANYGWSKDFWAGALPNRPVDQIRHSDIAQAIKDKVAAGVSGKTINNHLVVVRGIFELAEADELIVRNPTDKIKQHAHQSPLPDPFDRAEMEAILAHMAAHYPAPVLAYFEMLFCTGLRPSEAIALQWGDADWNRSMIRVQRARVLWEEKGTKTHTIRDVDLSDRALDVLRRQKPFTFMRGSDHAIFCNPISGKPWGDEQRQRRAYFQPTLRALGIRMRDAYNTRHTYATNALMAGVNPSYIARQLGHSTTAMLFRVYSRWIDGADKGSEARKMNDLLSSNCPRKAEGA